MIRLLGFENLLKLWFLIIYIILQNKKNYINNSGFRKLIQRIFGHWNRFFPFCEKTLFHSGPRLKIRT